MRRRPRQINSLHSSPNLERPERPARYGSAPAYLQEKHPGWEYYLWTDADKRELLRQHYSWFLPIYDGYDHLIKRADVITYFILHHYGGVYADLDFECLRPIEPLLEGKQLLFGLEPKEHLCLQRVVDRGFDKIVAHGFIASVPGHLFWEHVFKQLVGYHKAGGPLMQPGILC